MSSHLTKKYLPLSTVARDPEERRRLEALCRLGKLDSKPLGKEWLLAENEVDYGRDLARGFSFPDLLPLAKTAAVLLLLVLGSLFLPQVKKQISQLTNTQAPVGGPMLLAAVSPVFDRVTLSLAELQTDWFNLWRFITSESFYYRERLRLAWSNFGGGEANPTLDPATEVTVVTPKTDLKDVDRETIKAEIKRELLAEIERVATSQGQGGGSKQGLVAFPASGDPAKDALTREIIKEAFSNEVSVRLDASGRAGVITPVFQDTGTGDYLFLITPIKGE